jgi:putative membrane protein
MHMALHLTVAALAAPLLALGIANSRLDPSGRFPILLAPTTAALADLVVVWAWHAPALHDLPRFSAAWFSAEQVSFLIVGLLVWLAAFGAGSASGRERAAAGAGGLILTSMHMTLLGVLLALAPRSLYQACLGVGDQQTGGVLMLAVGGTVYMAGALALLGRLLGEDAQ